MAPFMKLNRSQKSAGRRDSRGFRPVARAVFYAVFALAFALGVHARLVRIIQGPMIAVPPPVTTGAKPGQNATFSRIQVDDSFGARDMLRTANHLVKSGHVAKAVREYQKIVQQFGRKVIATGPDSYESVEAYIWHLVVRLPAVRQGMYDQLYGLQAKTAVASAEKSGSIHTLVSIGRSYFPATAAAAAMRIAASRLFERGSFAAAARIWLSLMQHPAMQAQRPQLLDHAALAAWLAGQDALARRLDGELKQKYPHAMGLVNGTPVNLVAHLAAALVPTGLRVGEVRGRTRRWVTFQGNYRRNKIPDFDTAPSAVMWQAPISALHFAAPPGGPVNVAWRNSLQQRLALFGLRMNQRMRTPAGIMFSFPTRNGSTLYLNTMGRVRAMSIASGYAQWRYPRGHLPAARASGNLNTLLDSLDHFSVSVQGRNLYAIITNNSVTPTPFYYSPYGQAAATRLVCLHAQTGRPKWSIPVAALLGGGSVAEAVCSPMVTPRSVYLIVSSMQAGAGQTKLFLVRITAATGLVKHSRYLCTVTGATYSSSPLDIIPAMADGIVYIATGNGAALAVHAASGRIAWLTLTSLAHTAQANVGWGSVPRQLPWKINPPIVYRNNLITVDNNNGEPPTSGAKIYAFNRWTGQIYRQWRPSRLSGAFLTLGVIHGNLLTVGRRVDSVNVQTGKVAWKSRPVSQYGELQARPFLTRRVVYLPLNKGLLRISTRTGEIRDFVKWPVAGGGRPGEPGNLLVTRHQVIVANDQTVMDYSRWSDAERYLDRRIAAEPGNPLPRLTLAEVAFRTDHVLIARHSLAAAVAALGPGTAASAISSRIFAVCIQFGRNMRKLSGAAGADAAFFFNQARLAARLPRQQALWRYDLARYEIRTRKIATALHLLTAILSDPGLRKSPLRVGNNTMLAGAVARIAIDHDIIRPFGRPVYAAFDQAASALFVQAQSGTGTARLFKIVHRYPNSLASTDAAILLAGRLSAEQKFATAGRVLLAMRGGLSTTRRKAWWLGAMARNTAALGHWNAALSLADYGLMSYPAPVAGPLAMAAPTDFAAIVRHITATAPAGALFHRAKLNYGPNAGFAVANPIRGSLLVPLQRNPAWNRFDLFLVAHINSSGVRLRACRSATGHRLWTLRLPQEQRIALLGFQNHLAVLLTPNRILAVSCKTGKIVWSRRTAIPVIRKMALPGAFVAHPMIVVNNGVFFNGPAMIANGYAGNPMASFATQRTFARRLLLVFAQDLGPHSFQFVKMMRGGLLLEQANKLMLYSISTGLPLWKAPAAAAGLGDLINCNRIGDQLALAFNTPINTVKLLDYATGAPTGLMRFPNHDYLLWMGVGPAGTLYLSGIKAAMACNPQGDLSARVWELHKLADPFPMSTLLTTRGIVLPTLHGIESIDRATGVRLWRRASLPGSTANLPFLGTAINRGTLVLMTPASLLALSVRHGHVLWKAEFIAQRTPPLVNAHVGDPDIAVLAHGPLGDSPGATVLFLVNQADSRGRLDNGSLVLSKRLVRSANDPNGPNIANWEIVDNGIVFEVDSDVFLYHKTR